MGLGWDGSPGGRGYRAPYGANNDDGVQNLYLNIRYRVTNMNQSSWVHLAAFIVPALLLSFLINIPKVVLSPFFLKHKKGSFVTKLKRCKFVPVSFIAMQLRYSLLEKYHIDAKR